MVTGDVIGTAIFEVRADTEGFLTDIQTATAQAEGKFSKMGGTLTPAKIDVKGGDSVTKLKTDMADASTHTQTEVTKLNTMNTELTEIKRNSKIDIKHTGVSELKTELVGVKKEMTAINKLSSVAGFGKSKGLGALSVVAGAGAVFSPEIASLAGGASMLTPIFAGLGALLLPIIVIVGAIVAVFLILYATSGTFRDVVAGIVEKAQELFGWVSKVVEAFQSGDFGKVGELLKTGFLDFINLVKNIDWKGVWDTVVKIFQESFSTISTFFASIDWGGIAIGLLAAIGGALLQIGTFFARIDWGALGNAIWTAIKSWLNPKFLKLLTDQLVTIGSFIFDKIKTGLAGLGKWFQDLLSGFGQWVWNGFMVYFNFSAKLRAEFVNLLSSFGQWVWDGLITAFNFMTKLRTEFVNLLMGFGQWVWDGLVTAFNFYVKFGTEFANLLLSFGSWVWSGIGTLWEDLKAGFKTVADDFGGAINNILHPPTATPAQETQDAASLQNKSVLQTVFGLSTGGVVRSRPGGVPVILGEGQDDEYVIPASKMGHGGIIGGGLVSALGSPGGKTSQSGDTHFHVQFNNATLTSVDEADKLGRRMAYTANEYLRRSGHSRG